MSTWLQPARVFHWLAASLWLVYVGAWGVGYLDWLMVLAYSVVCTVAWAETGNEEWECNSD